MTSSRAPRSRNDSITLFIVLAAAAAGAIGCGGAPAKSGCPAAMNVAPSGAAWLPVDDTRRAVTASFTVAVDPTAPSLASQWRQPHADAVAITGSAEVAGGQVVLQGGAKRFATIGGRIYLELYLVSSAALGLGDVTLTVADMQHAAAFYDLGADPFAAASPELPTLAVGGVGPEGTSTRIRLAVDEDGSRQPITFSLALAATTTTRTATTSAPIAVTRDGREVLATYPDGDILAILDGASNRRLAQVAVAGRPSSVAITPDGKLALVACAACNQLVVVDRASRKTVQIFGEAQGIGREPRNVVLSPDGARAFVSAYVGDRITALTRVGDAFRIDGGLGIGRRPVGMSLTPDGKTLFAAHFLPHGPIEDNGGFISVIDTASLTEVATAELRDDGNVEEASCLAMVSAFSGYSGQDLSFEATPTQLAGVFLSPGGGEGWVPGVRVAGFPILEGDVSTLGFQFATLGANSPMMLFPLDTRQPRAAAFRRVASVIDFSDRPPAFLQCYPGLDDVEAVRAQPGPDDGTLAFNGVTIPSQATQLSDSGAARFVAWSRGGRRALVLSYLADQLIVLDGATHSPTSIEHLTLAGANPTGMAVSPDGRRGFVTYENSPFVSVLDLAAYADPLPPPSIVPYRMDPGAAAGQGAAIITFEMLVRDVSEVPSLPPAKELAEIPLVDADPMDPTLRRGKILFTSSSPDKYPTLTDSREAACAACHPNGGNDGSAWSTMEGERRTIGLWGGTAGRGWLHASGTHRSAYDFATTIVHDRLGGSGLSPSDADALSGYVAHGIPALQRPVTDERLVARGAQLFSAHCAGCHAGGDGGDGNADGTSALGGGAGQAPPLHDVGTATDWAHVTLGQAYTHLFPPTARMVLDLLRGDRALGAMDPVQMTLMFTPRPERARGVFKAASLIDAWENDVYFHDARFTSLDEAVAYFSSQLGLALDAPDRSALVEYLKSR